MSQVKHFEMPDGTIIDVPSGGSEGSSVIPNPEITEDAPLLYGLEINGKIYKLATGGESKVLDTVKANYSIVLTDEMIAELWERQQGTTETVIELPSDNAILLGLTNQGTQLVSTLQYNRDTDTMENNADISRILYKANMQAYRGGMNIVEARITKTADKTYELYWSLGSNYGTIWLTFSDSNVSVRNSWDTNSCDLFILIKE